MRLEMMFSESDDQRREPERLKTWTRITVVLHPEWLKIRAETLTSVFFLRDLQEAGRPPERLHRARPEPGEAGSWISLLSVYYQSSGSDALCLSCSGWTSPWSEPEPLCFTPSAAASLSSYYNLSSTSRLSLNPSALQVHLDRRHTEPVSQAFICRLLFTGSLKCFHGERTQSLFWSFIWKTWRTRNQKRNIM